jgi:hypothetical protein
MRVVLKGIDSAVKRLADGSTRTYYYAWRGGPRLEGAPGTPDFVASHNAAVAGRPTRRNGKTLEGIVDSYLDSQDFATKRDRTREEDRKIARRIVAEFGDMPLAALPTSESGASFWNGATSSPRLSLGWRVHMRCANGYRQETRSMTRCVYRKQLDLETLVYAPSSFFVWY